VIVAGGFRNRLLIGDAFAREALSRIVDRGISSFAKFGKGVEVDFGYQLVRLLVFPTPTLTDLGASPLLLDIFVQVIEIGHLSGVFFKKLMNTSSSLRSLTTVGSGTSIESFSSPDSTSFESTSESSVSACP